jgi:hypothetical protein
MSAKLDDIELRLQALLEKGLLFLQSPTVKSQLATQITQALQDSCIIEDDLITPPSRFIIFLHPDTAKAWENENELLAFLEESLQESAQESGICFSVPPSIKICASPAVQPGELKVTSSGLEDEQHGKTAMLQLPEEFQNEAQKNAECENFLIVNGLDLFSLGSTLVKIGRNTDNHLVVKDNRVSRNHAQIRRIHGKYVIFDLNSKGGTFINGKPITQRTLKPGDVISLAGFPMIFGEDSAAMTGEGDSTSFTGSTARVEPEQDFS